MAENSMRDAILSVVEAKGGSAEGVGPLDRDALDRLLDVMAGSDQPVTSGMSDAQVVRALAQYAHGGGGGGSTVDVTLWNSSENESSQQVIPEHIRLLAGYDSQGAPVYSDQIPFEQVTTTYQGMTIYGVRISGVKVGAVVQFELPAGYALSNPGMAYAPADAPLPPGPTVGWSTVPSPLDGFIVTGSFGVIKL